jgi:hypothetical protein
MLRILYLDLNIYYLNPTRNHLVQLLKNVGELSVYGPGYCSEEVLLKGVDEFVIKNGPFDIVAANEHVVFTSQNITENLQKTKQTYKRNYVLQFNMSNLDKYIFDMYEYYEKSEAKVLFLLESDYYNFQESKLQRLDQLACYIVGWGEQFVTKLSELENLKYETFGSKANDNWYEFVKSNNKLIQLPHFVSESEFNFESLENRKNTVGVAGVNYYNRKRVAEEIKKSEYGLAQNNMSTALFSLLRKCGAKTESNPALMRLNNVLFRNHLEHTKSVYTCGSGLNYPIRKFFEIPALGSLLLATPFKNADMLGFVDGEIYLETHHKNIIQKLDWIEQNKEEAQQIAVAGQDLMWNCHTLGARARQLSEAFEAIINNRFTGTYWEGGTFYVR